jgi:UDP-glucuronate 4-epimerase
MKTALVTGGAGFIGSSVCKELIRRGFKVICLDSFENNYPVILKQKNISGMLGNTNFLLAKQNINDFAALEKLFSEHTIDYAFHLAARTGVRPSVEDPAAYFQTNVNGTINVLDMCVKHKVKKVIFASSSSVYGSKSAIPFSEEEKALMPDSPYGVSKLAAEHICRIYNAIYGLPITCLRFFTVYGPRGRPDMAPYIFVDKIYKGQPLEVFGDGSSMRDYTFIDDIVQGIMAAFEADFGFEIFNLGNSSPVKLLDFIHVIEDALGKKAELRFRGKQPGDMERTYADIRKAGKLLKFKPAIPIKEGIKQLAKWYKEECAA